MDRLDRISGKPMSSHTRSNEMRDETPQPRPYGATASVPPTDRCVLFEMPGELRNRIYQYALTSSAPIVYLADKEPFHPSASSTEATTHSSNSCSAKEKRGTLKFNAGAEFIFHETVGSTGVANFVHFYKRCSPANQECMRAVSIIELEMNVDHADRDIPMPAMSIANNYSPLPYERFPDAGPKEVRRFNRREPMLIGRAGEASLLLYNICRLTPTLHVVLRYTDRDGTASWDWIQETGTETRPIFFCDGALGYICAGSANASEDATGDMSGESKDERFDGILGWR
ncbi:hypothetical protein BU26DRAFT_508782 [Trematosphaeria pertusa]|uniref:Uncharacterized protein n=1 Tax=Trematosphaeria pertusa TaxID=390896 RepID=A0A6A6I3A8_9PLEO|nr:uncharacterized protein BU26DRAFT_508782 [Trematosphaeria pertusa]KAF2244801.1 hypothetical protein BU26DRAFT_508782 [Trematosphaeria pertusa]